MESKTEPNHLRDFSPIDDLPNVPAVYALYSGGERSRYVAYVGIATKLKQRVQQHLNRRDSSVSIGVSAVSLLADQVTGLGWWEHPNFSDAATLKAAEQIAFEIQNPILRSRGRVEDKTTEKLQDKAFREDMERLFSSETTGAVKFLTLSDAMDRIRKLETTVKDLQRQIDKLNG